MLTKKDKLKSQLLYVAKKLRDSRLMDSVGLYTEHGSRYPPEMGELVKAQNRENHVFSHVPGIVGPVSAMDATNTTCRKGKGHLIPIVTVAMSLKTQWTIRCSIVHSGRMVCSRWCNASVGGCS